MNETLILILTCTFGGLIGLIFFGGLWWTVRKSLTSRYAALLFMASLMLRMSVALTGFYFIGRDHWQRLLACLLGFVVARVVVMRLTGSRLQHHTSSSAEVRNAS